MLYVPYRTTTVMQITEYNLLSQSTNVFLFFFYHPLAPKDQRVCSFLHFFFFYIYLCFGLCDVCDVSASRVNVCDHMLAKCRCERIRWVSRSRLVTRVRSQGRSDFEL